MFESMTVTHILAALLGLYFIAAGIGFLRDRSVVATMFQGLKTQPMLGYLGGLIAFSIGGAMVAVHNDWSTWLASFVSLVGWAALIEGVLLLAVRDWFMGLFDGLLTSDSLLKGLGLATVAAGAVLVWCAVA